MSVRKNKLKCLAFSLNFYLFNKGRYTDRKTKRWTQRQTDGQKDRDVYRVNVSNDACPKEIWKNCHLRLNECLQTTIMFLF